MTAATLGLGNRLPDLCTEFFAFVLELAQSEDPGDGEELRVRINRLLEGVQSRAQQLEVRQTVVDTARYALVALVDEVILTSSWSIKSAWLGRPLQMEHFNNFAAGEEFFRRLDAIRAASDPYRLDLLEVYHLCLCLGFKGKHGGVQGLEVLRVLKNELSAELQAVAGSKAPVQGAAVSARDVAVGSTRRKTNPNDLSPAWRPPHHVAELTRQLPVRVVVVICLVVFVLLFSILAGVLSSQTGDVVELLK